jgi:hypothetical protein
MASAPSERAAMPTQRILQLGSLQKIAGPQRIVARGLRRSHSPTTHGGRAALIIVEARDRGERASAPAPIFAQRRDARTPSPRRRPHDGFPTSSLGGWASISPSVNGATKRPDATAPYKRAGDRGRTGDVQLGKLIDDGPEDYDPCGAQLQDRRAVGSTVTFTDFTGSRSIALLNRHHHRHQGGGSFSVLGQRPNSGIPAGGTDPGRCRAG